MISGVTVTVMRPCGYTGDRFGNLEPTESASETVHDVLVSPGSTSDLEAARPEGVDVALTLHFPKPYAQSLHGCTVQLTGPWAGTYRVIGDPKPYIMENTPTRWWYPVEVEAAHG
ncbi:hypothetical protein [Bifidobacterium sp.]|uniref:hypothetical protein n=1 Tax=Bifidobacterium sp. TaxID=41200 RepID=UPI00386940BF